MNEVGPGILIGGDLGLVECLGSRRLFLPAAKGRRVNERNGVSIYLYMNCLSM